MMEAAELALREALRRGATEAEAYIRRMRILEIGFAERIEGIKSPETLGLSLRVAVGRRVATYSSSLLEKDEVLKAAGRAVKIAKVAPEDPDWRHLNRRFGESPAPGGYDGETAELQPEEVVETLLSAVGVIGRREGGVKPARGMLTITESETQILNSYGESCIKRETHVAVWLRAKAEGRGREATANEHQEVRSWNALNLQGLAERVAERAAAFLDAKPIPSGEMPIIFRNQVFASILVNMLGGPVTADWAQKGRSPLAGKLNQEVASEAIIVFDDGLMPQGWRTTPFDDEGHPTQRTALIEGGILRGYLYDSYTALKEGVESTGNAFRRRYWMPPEPSPTNLLLRPGDATLEEMIQETRRGLYVEETIGEWLSNPVSGQLNATVTHGYLIENGELGRPIKGVVLTGDFQQLLLGGIDLIGRDQANTGGGYSPSVRARGLTVAGE
ncbi:MAG: peptidase U62 modulator of DNA gyrase [Candidatus Bathyarchaeota archaeon B23]|nr:MAG: peptidase U62 modulator of DNA gyrase [Candidatus Bathyarchaeota archaeon B23]